MTLKVELDKGDGLGQEWIYNKLLLRAAAAAAAVAAISKYKTMNLASEPWTLFWGQHVVANTQRGRKGRATRHSCTLTEVTDEIIWICFDLRNILTRIIS